MKELTLGSLFDGSGTCPLAAWLCGIRPVWASEIEDYPKRVTMKNFPDMIHLGDITKIDGAKIPPVDIITGGSPCQDLSVAAGERKGLSGERSGLFLEMIRVIREMLEATDGKFPRILLWENVLGSFTSSAGYDFLTVLQNFASLADPFAYVPEPEKRNGRLHWAYSGSMEGDGYSLAWRTFDSQFWGVPQRRRRVLLAVDLRSGGGANKILYEREGVFGYPPQGWRKEQAIASVAGDSADTAIPLDYNPSDARLAIGRERERVTATLQARMGTGGNQGPMLLWKKE